MVVVVVFGCMCNIFLGCMIEDGEVVENLKYIDGKRVQIVLVNIIGVNVEVIVFGVEIIVEI